MKKQLITIVGPTAVGKTELAINLAHLINFLSSSFDIFLSIEFIFEA